MMGVDVQVQAVGVRDRRRHRRPRPACCSPGKQGFVNPTKFTLHLSILVLAVVRARRFGNIGGAILGGILVVYLPERLRRG